MTKTKGLLFTAGIALALAFTLSCSFAWDKDKDDDGNNNPGSGGGYTGSYGSVSHGGRTYKTVKIGTQIWMAENLNYDPGTGNSACYDNEASNCATYGRLYDWATAMGLPSGCRSSNCSDQIVDIHQHQGICPDGWHIPSGYNISGKSSDWEKLISAAGGRYDAGGKLKATSGWNNHEGKSCNGTNEFGFSALPGGAGYSDGSFFHVGNAGNWRSANGDIRYSTAYVYYVSLTGAFDGWGIMFDDSDLLSVRCVKD